MNMMDRNLKYQPQPPQHRRKTPSFSSSLLDSILRSIDESNDQSIHHQQQQAYDRDHNDHDIRFFASEPKRSTKIYFPQTHTINGADEQMPSLRRAIMIDQWMETHNNNKHHNGYVSSKSTSRKFSSDSSSSGTTSSGTETPSTYRSLPNSFTISRKTAEIVDFRDDTHQQVNNSINKREMKFMKSTRLKAMKIYGDLKKVKQPMSPGSRISTFLYSLFASSSSKKAKIEETMRSLKKSRSIKQDSSTTTCTSFSRSCMSKKQRNSNVKRSVKFYPENDTVILDQKSIHEHPNLPKYERRWLQEKKYMKNYKSFTVNVGDEDEDEDEDEDDLFELEIVGGLGNHVAYGQELPVFETTDLRKIRI